MIIEPLHDEQIDDFTLDMYFQFAKMTSDPFYISVYTNRDNDFMLGNRAIMIGTSKYSLSIDNSAIKLGTYYRLTVTRKGNKLRMYFNGKLEKELDVNTFKVPTGAFWVLGQEQDSRGGGFNAKQRFIGNICDFQMWNVGLTKEKAPNFFKNVLAIGDPALYNSPPSYKFQLKDATQLQEEDLVGTNEGEN